MQITPASLENFFQGLNYAFKDGYESTPTLWEMLATKAPSGTEKNVYPFLSMIPGLREWVGPRTINNIAARSYSLPNKHWEDTIAVDRNKLEDDQYGFYDGIAAMLGEHVAEFPDRKLTEIIEAGEDELCWDGQPYFDENHPVDPDDAGAGVNSNLLTGSEFDLATTDPTEPYRLAKAAMAAWVREDGKRLGTKPTHIMVGSDLEKYALQVKSALNVAQTVGSAAASASNVFNGSIEVIVNPLIEGEAWYLAALNRKIKPFLWQQRQEANLVPLTNVTDPNVFYMRQFVYGVDLRANGGYTFPFLCFKMKAS